MKELSIEDQIYLCKYHDIDESICYSTGLKKSEIEKSINNLKDIGLYEKYRKMSEEEYEKVIEDEKKKSKYNNSKANDTKKQIVKIEDIENTFVKVSVKTMMECSYYKGYLDRMLEEENK